ncbi:MAG: hypothetical protein KF760_14815 [Candidatus Eremiobacteraeota bacterium]|nr:hypothetical protein [Candidatus Eremiobacteraeota bacterium]MCW5869832.1 hypothetical protein [Candidatus Eremiobacteraeota bacterium]
MRKGLLVGSFLLLSAVAWPTPKFYTSVISGWIRAASEDAKGKVLTVEIVVGEEPAEEPYLVTGPKSSELQALIGEWVVASGTVKEDELGWKSLEVKRFTKIDDLPPPTEVPSTTPSPEPPK